MIKQGRIYKILSKFYYVKVEENIYECMAKGKFKNIGTNLYVGDIVDIQIDKFTENKGNIINVHNRKNCIIRPNVANIDKLIITLSILDPIPNLVLLDKQIINCHINNIEPIICITKIDIDKNKEYLKIKELYEKIGYKVFAISNIVKQGIEKLEQELEGSFCVLSGNSGIGKSSLVNNILGYEVMQPGKISEKIKRGKQTTRHIEIFEKDNIMIADTPGFSVFEDVKITKKDVIENFIEFNEYIGMCQYRDCAHIKENNCAIKDAVENNEISIERYNRFIQIYNECD